MVHAIVRVVVHVYRNVLLHVSLNAVTHVLLGERLQVQLSHENFDDLARRSALAVSIRRAVQVAAMHNVKNGLLLTFRP